MSAEPSGDQRIAALLDKQEIEECIKRVARGLDRHDTELARSGFHPDGRDDHALFIGSAYDMVDWANAFHSAGLRSHLHLLTNILIELDGDEAHAETYVTVVGVAKDWSHTAGGGRYLDRLERRENRWGIVDRVTTVEWWTDPEATKQNVAISINGRQDRTDLSYTRPLRVTREPVVITTGHADVWNAPSPNGNH